MSATALAPHRIRIAGLDGIRGLAALYVVAHHCWLLCYPGYPANTGPAWTGWLLHGRLAVVVFITLSGFSLAAAPARNDWRLGGVASYLRRRARRILPPYWAALALSLLVVAFSHRIAERSVLVYGLMLQDFVTAPAPNRAFWSIAVEAGLYLAFPLLLLLRRRAGAVVTLAVVCVPVVAARLVWPTGGGYTWELAPLFTIGMVAAGLRAHPWAAALAAAPVVAVIAVAGPVWTVRHYFWIDLAAGPAIAAFLASVPRFLNGRPLTWLGGCSYSLYLIHMPVVALVSRHLVPSHAFLPTVLVAVPASVLAAAAFAEIFERGRYSGTS